MTQRSALSPQRRASLARWLVTRTLALSVVLTARISADDHPLLTWVLRHPKAEGSPKPSPRLGYEASYGYDPQSRLLLRYGGHNQGGGGEQNSELWTYDLDRDLWTLREPDDAPPGVCCAQQNVFDPLARRFLRFPSFSASHGWQSRREVYLKDSSVWAYDPAANRWRNRRPLPEPEVRPLRGAAFDPDLGVVVLHGGEGAGHGTVVYDPHANTWHFPSSDPAPEPSLSQPGFAYDRVHRLFVLFGSQFASDPRTWVYDLRANRWRVLEVPEHPPADKTSPVLAADTLSGIVLAVIDGPEGNETWALDVAKPQWRRLEVPKEPERSGPRNRILTYLEDRNFFVLENRTKNEQQVLTFRYAEAPPPSPLIDLSVVTKDSGAALEWTQAGGASGRRWELWRGKGRTAWEAKLERVAPDLREPRCEDSGLESAAMYFYQVRLLDESGAQRGASSLGSTRPPLVEDLTVSVLGPGEVLVEWEPPAAQDLAGFHVERAEVSVYSAGEVMKVRERYASASDLAVGRLRTIGAFRRLTKSPVTEARFRDRDLSLLAAPRAAGTAAADRAAPPDARESVWDRPLRAEDLDSGGKPYRFRVFAYRVAAVNRLGVEGGPSPARFTYPSAVREIFSREEDGGKTRLRWRRSTERGVLGYLVFRHDGRWDKDPIVKLTPEPIDAAEFLDEAGGESTRRYEVVAVDVLGQQGEPSQPVWSRREWRRFYVPYTGEWHQ